MRTSRLATLMFWLGVGAVTLAFAVFFSELPDWLEVPWYLWFAKQDKHGPSKNAGVFEVLAFQIKQFFNRFHTKASFPFGVITQVVTVIFFYFLLS